MTDAAGPIAPRAGNPALCAKKLLPDKQFLRINLREAPRSEPNAPILEAHGKTPSVSSRCSPRRLRGCRRMRRRHGALAPKRDVGPGNADPPANVYRQLHKYFDGVLDDGSRKCGLQDVPQRFEP